MMEAATWKKILDMLRPVRASVEILLRSAKPISFDGNDLVVGVYYKFHKDSLDDIKNKIIFEDVLKQVFNKNITVECVLCEPQKIQSDVKPAALQDDISVTAEEIFTS